MAMIEILTVFVEIREKVTVEQMVEINIEGFVSVDLI